MKNSDVIKYQLGQLYNENDDYVVDPKREADTLAFVKGLMVPENEFTEEDTKVWKREIRFYEEIEDVTILDLLDNLCFYLAQPEEYHRVTDWRI